MTMIHRFYVPALLAALLIPAALPAQTITTESLEKQAFCPGEETTVAYSVQGAFNPGNAFILQLSGPDGSFDQEFRNMESVVSSGSGSFRVEIPADLKTGDDDVYRFRVIGSSPRVDGSDNGEDFTVDPLPWLAASIHGGLQANDRNGGTRETKSFVMGMPVSFRNETTKAVAYEWVFGQGAEPPTSTATNPTTTYVSPGRKVIALTGISPNGCRSTTWYYVNVLESTRIPADANLVQAGGTIANGSPAYWVCPGGRLKLGRGDDDAVVYAEAGAKVEIDRLAKVQVYLKAGASLEITGGPNFATVIYEAGAGISGDPGTDVALVAVSTINFDYSIAPPAGCPSLAPYTIQIGPDVRRIHVPEQDDRSDVKYWIRQSGSLNGTGDGNEYYVEPGGAVTVEGNNNKIYVKEGGALDIRSGDNNRIFYEVKATIKGEGTDPVLLPSSGITFVEQVSGVHDRTGSEGVSLLTATPNPTLGDVELRIDPSMGRIVSVEIVDAVGRKAFSADAEGTALLVPMSKYPAGVYHARVLTSNGVLTERIVVR